MHSLMILLLQKTELVKLKNKKTNRSKIMRLKNFNKTSRLVLMVVVLCITNYGCSSNKWVTLFDGKTLNGWKTSENKDAWKAEDGMIVTKGERSHLFYVGEYRNHTFKNFEFSVDVKTEEEANSGLYFHTEYQDFGWPNKGYECQIFNGKKNHKGDGYIERKLTGSIYGIRNSWKSPTEDNVWFNYRIVVQGKTIQTFINDNLICEYTEPDSIYRFKGNEGRILSAGTFALQCHDPGSLVYFKNIKVRSLSDDIDTPGKPIEDFELEKKIITHSTNNFPLIDLHVHLKGGLTMEQALANARKYGLTYGIAVNCGLKMGYEIESDLRIFLENYEKPPQTFLAMQAEGREWLDIFSEEIISEFDYVFTDAMTWTNKNGKRMRLWIDEETEVGDPQDFMDQLVDNIEKIMNNEPIDIYVNSTYLPKEISDQYDALWTEERMDRVINVLLMNNIALEIGSRYTLPSSKFIKRAKKAGVTFTFGTNNSTAKNLGHIQNCLDMIEECELKPEDIWMLNKNN